MIFPIGVSKFKRTGLDKLTNSLILWVSILTDAGVLFFRQVVIWFNFIVVQKCKSLSIWKTLSREGSPLPPPLPPLPHPPKKRDSFGRMKDWNWENDQSEACLLTP